MLDSQTTSRRHHGLSTQHACAFARRDDVEALCREAAALRDARFGNTVTCSRKVFIPLTKLCRDMCHDCTFATTPRSVPHAFMSLDEVVAAARQGARAGCDAARLTLGEKPELRYAQARNDLAEMGYATTLDYLHAATGAVLREIGLLPHINAGTMPEAEIDRLKQVSASQGLMVETTTERLSAKGEPHYGSPDKRPAARRDWIDALLRIRAMHETHAHIQEVIIQNFRTTPGTRMAGAPEPSLREHQWTIAAARLVFGPDISIQALPNLRLEDMADLIGAGLKNWGGVSPVTPDFVNPEFCWPALDTLRTKTEAAGKDLALRLTVYPRYRRRNSEWIAPGLAGKILAKADGVGLAHETPWRVGIDKLAPQALNLLKRQARRVDPMIRRITDAWHDGHQTDATDIARLFGARGADAGHIRASADAVRRARCGDDVTFVVNHDINYTNICSYRCTFCAFSKGGGAQSARGNPYDIGVTEAVDHGATEACLQGGIHPDYGGETYIAILDAVRAAEPGLHIHAFSALEVQHEAETLGLSIPDYLARLKSEGLHTLPGTAAEILGDEVRGLICPNKLNTDTWLAIHEAAHDLDLRCTATMMFGHVHSHVHRARHILRIRALQARTGGFTECVPLTFVHMEAPMYRKGASRQGPSLRESLLVHAVARLVLDPVLPNIQASWVKQDPEAATETLTWGVNDLGGTLMNESISRAAGSEHGQLVRIADLRRIAAMAGRPLSQRTTLYGDAPDRVRLASAHPVRAKRRAMNRPQDMPGWAA